MEQEAQQYRAESLALCEKLLGNLKNNKEDADEIFGGEIYKAYVNATETAINKAKRIKNKIGTL